MARDFASRVETCTGQDHVGIFGRPHSCAAISGLHSRSWRMIEVHRVVEDQVKLTSYRATEDAEKAIQLEILIDLTKPPKRQIEWHELIYTPFRYNLPVLPRFQARFKPPYFQKNVFYASGLL